MLTTILPLAIGAIFASLTMTTLWFVQRRTANAGIVDVAWAAVIGVLGLLYASWPQGDAALRTLVGLMISLWSLRLTVYLFRRVVGHPEEGRYAALRRSWGDDHGRKLFFFYQLQAAAAWVFASPVMAISRSEPPAAWMTALAVVLWGIGITGVALADRQLAQFKQRRDSGGKTCRYGLWRYSRHPNYFFEWIHWTSYIPLACGDAYWLVPTMVAGLLLYFVLFVTGIPPTEAQAVASRGDDYRQYQRTTSSFVPWFPRARAGT